MSMKGGLGLAAKKEFENLKRHGVRQCIYRGLRQVLYYANRGVVSYYFARHFRDYVIREINGRKMLLSLGKDAGISKDLYIFGRREDGTTDYVLTSGIVREGDTVMDIGANIGYYVLIWSGLVGENGLVYAIEPVEENYGILRKNMELNGVNNIETYQVAAGGVDGEDYLYVCSKRNYSAFYPDGLPEHVSGKDIKMMEKVKVVTVDSFLKDKKHPVLIRMDVEGYESEVIKGMEKTLEDDIMLLVEVHMNIMGPGRFREMVCALRDKGFTDALIIYDNEPLELAGRQSRAGALIDRLDCLIKEKRTGGRKRVDILKVLEEESTCQMLFCKKGAGCIL